MDAALAWSAANEQPEGEGSRRGDATRRVMYRRKYGGITGGMWVGEGDRSSNATGGDICTT